MPGMLKGRRVSVTVRQWLNDEEAIVSYGGKLYGMSWVERASGIDAWVLGPRDRDLEAYYA